MKSQVTIGVKNWTIQYSYNHLSEKTNYSSPNEKTFQNLIGLIIPEKGTYFTYLKATCTHKHQKNEE